MNTLLYYGSSHNHTNVWLLEFVCNAMPLASLVLGVGGEGGDKVSDSMFQVLVNGVAQLPSPTSNNDAPNVDVSNIIVLNITLEGDDNARHVVDLP